MKKYILSALVITLLFWSIWVFSHKPSHDRNWELGHEQLPEISIDTDEVTITNLRDFVWQQNGGAEVRYLTQEYDLNQIETVDVIISHFSEFEGLAHIFLSFVFSDGKNVVVSLETRRENDEEFSPWWGLWRQFEIIYVVGTENDIIGVRQNIRKERVYRYPTIASAEKARELFLKVSEDINAIADQPKFYNTLLNNCTNSLTRRVEEISDARFPLTYKTLLPGYFDEVLYQMQLIPTDDTFEDIKKRYLVEGEI